MSEARGSATSGSGRDVARRAQAPPAGWPDPAAPWRGKAGPLFDRNARRYDSVNRIITFGMDQRWRRWLVERAALSTGARALDACAGTGLLGLELARRGAQVTLLDASPVMLDSARRRAAAAGLDVDVVVADVEDEATLSRDLAPRHGTAAPFDVVGMAFGLRYFVDPAAVLSGYRALLRPGGRLLVVDAVMPPRTLVGRAAGFYFFEVAPRVATVLAGRAELYDSLTASVRALGDAARVRRLIGSAGFRVTEERPFVGGMVRAFVAVP